MRRKCIDISANGINIVCIKDDQPKPNSYIIYRRWYDVGWHRKKIDAFADFPDALEYINCYYWSVIRGYVPMRPFSQFKGE